MLNKISRLEGIVNSKFVQTRQRVLLDMKFFTFAAAIFFVVFLVNNTKEVCGVQMSSLVYVIKLKFHRKKLR